MDVALTLGGSKKDRARVTTEAVLAATAESTSVSSRASTVPPFAEIFRENAKYVWRCLLHFGVPERDAEDVCQEVFVTAHRKLDEGVVPEQLRAWLYGICWRTASAHRRRGYRRREIPTEEVDAGVTEDSEPARKLDERRRLVQLDAALGALTDDQRAVFVLYEIEQLTMREVSASLECSINTAFSRLYAARARFASALGIVVPEEVWKR